MNGLKQILYIPLLFLYLFSTAGLPLEAHFCGDKLSGVSIFETTHANCCKPLSKRRKINCCNDVKVNIKVKDQHLHSGIFALNVPYKPACLHSWNSVSPFHVEQTKGTKDWAYRYPPPPLSENRYLRLNVLLI